MFVRPASPAIHAVHDFDTGAVAARIAESRKASRGSLSARCRRLEENMLTNLSALQSHRRGLEDVVQSRKDKAEKSKQEIRQAMKDLMKPSTRDGSVLGIAPLNFQTLRDRTAALEDNVNSNREEFFSNRSILKTIQAARLESAPVSARTELPDDATNLNESDSKNDDTTMADKCRAIEESARRIGAHLQESVQTENTIQVEQRETRQFLLFGIPPVRPDVASTAAMTTTSKQPRPLSAPAVASRTSMTRPSSVLSQRPASALSRSSRPTSANSLCARIKLMEANVRENKQVLATNKDGLEVVKRRREQAAKAVADCLAALTAANSGNY